MDAGAARSEPKPRAPRAWRPWPWLTVAIVVTAGLTGAFPSFAAALEYQRTRVEAGEVWRLATGQAVHWSPRMAAADLGMVLLLGALLETRSRRLCAVTFTAGTIVCGFAVHYLHPALNSYRGASGVATALLTALVVLLLRTGKTPLLRSAAALGLAFLLLKMMAEAVTGRAFFAGSLPSGVEVTPLVHLAGAIAGVAVALTVVQPERRRTSPPETSR